MTFLNDKSSFMVNHILIKNSFVLYLRMLLILIINLYTSRLILKYLGVEDYGVYNVIGGVVGMFSLLSNSLSNAISRFLKRHFVHQ